MMPLISSITNDALGGGDGIEQLGQHRGIKQVNQKSGEGKPQPESKPTPRPHLSAAAIKTQQVNDGMGEDDEHHGHVGVHDQ
ncbi:MAG: hypothetical protein ACE5EY_18025, partial [Anaerolineae bacterium]